VVLLYSSFKTHWIRVLLKDWSDLIHICLYYQDMHVLVYGRVGGGGVGELVWQSKCISSKMYDCFETYNYRGISMETRTGVDHRCQEHPRQVSSLFGECSNQTIQRLGNYANEFSVAFCMLDINLSREAGERWRLLSGAVPGLSGIPWD
jgi:hypothetical protein